MSYDPRERRDTPLARRLKSEIANSGPVTVAAYMKACLQDDEHGYYRTRPPIGQHGDFTTAPEISQVFGELIGLWAAVAWQQMGRPDRCTLAELGPGRGTLMRDALRAARIVPGFLAAVHVVLVEINPVSIADQKDLLAPLAPRLSWARHTAAIPRGPTILIANEFLDTLPIAQYVRTTGAWSERIVTLDAGGALAFGTAERRPLHFLPGEAEPGCIAERRQTLEHTFALHRIAAAGPLAALFIDYGYAATATADTLQAVRAQRYEHPLTSPGEADLTALVDFDRFAREARTLGFATDGPMTQAEFLGSLGIIERGSRLMAANPTLAGVIEAGIARLIAPGGMGTRFKAIGIRSPSLTDLAGFASPRALA